MEKYSEAASSFAEGIRLLTPLFQKTPPAFAQLIGNLCKSYIQACEKAHTVPDMALLAPVAEVLQKPRSSSEKE
jgi:hypothetical protein